MLFVCVMILIPVFLFLYWVLIAEKCLCQKINGFIMLIYELVIGMRLLNKRVRNVVVWVFIVEIWVIHYVNMLNIKM